MTSIILRKTHALLRLANVVDRLRSTCETYDFTCPTSIAGVPSGLGGRALPRYPITVPFVCVFNGLGRVDLYTKSGMVDLPIACCFLYVNIKSNCISQWWSPSKVFHGAAPLPTSCYVVSLVSSVYVRSRSPSSQWAGLWSAVKTVVSRSAKGALPEEYLSHNVDENCLEDTGARRRRDVSATLSRATQVTFKSGATPAWKKKLRWYGRKT